jgi:hypothetical protein
MRAIPMALGLGVAGAIAGLLVASGSGVTSLQPVWAFSGAAWFAILGATIGGVAEIVEAIKQSK